MVKDKRRIITVYPTKKHPIRGWLAEDEVKIGSGHYGNVFKVCRKKNCDFIIKVIHKSTHENIKKEICMQKTCAKHGLCKPVEDWWLLQGEGGVIITPVLNETLFDRILNVEVKVLDDYFHLDGVIPEGTDPLLHKELDEVIFKDQFELIKLGWEMILKLHQLGIVHGDATADNIMLDENDRLYFIDMAFGIIMGKEYTETSRKDNNISFFVADLMGDYHLMSDTLTDVNNTYDVLYIIGTKMKDLVRNGKSYKDAEKEVIEKLLATRYEDFKFYKSRDACTIL